MYTNLLNCANRFNNLPKPAPTPTPTPYQCLTAMTAARTNMINIDDLLPPIEPHYSTMERAVANYNSGTVDKGNGFVPIVNSNIDIVNGALAAGVPHLPYLAYCSATNATQFQNCVNAYNTYMQNIVALLTQLSGLKNSC